MGKTPFSKISPKKTWEGTIGGALLCIMVIALLGSIIPVARVIPVRHWIAIAAICAVFGTMGDLLESKIKRMADVKDSGSFMPGHGGFLDRFDSLLVAIPFVWLYVVLFI
jgi:phosphatidate cytidylyltransferase